MALFEKYDGRRAELIKKMQNMAEFEKSDESVGQIFAIAREILQRPINMTNVQFLLTNGGKLAAYYGYLAVKGNEAWAEYKMAEVAFKEVRDALMLALKSEKHTVTEAKASAGRETAYVEVDVIAREKRSRDFESAARWCQSMLSFIQSTMRQLESERTHLKIAERGRQ
jgi:hypothetical protein